mgnify:CR=1 FL=1
MSGIVYPVTNFQQFSGGSDPNPPPSAPGDIIIDLDPEERCYNNYLTDVQCTDGDRVVRWFHTGAEPNGAWKMAQQSEDNQPIWQDGGILTNYKPYVWFPNEQNIPGTEGQPYFYSWMKSEGAGGMWAGRSNTMSIYAVVITDDSQEARTYNVLMEKNSDWNWDDGWVLNFQDSNDFHTYVGTRYGSAYPPYPATNEIVNTSRVGFSGSPAPKIYSLRFNADSSGREPEYINQNYSGAFSGNTQLGTTTDFDQKYTPMDYIHLACSENSSGVSGSYRWRGKILRILGYSAYHDDTTHASVISALETTYT